MKRELFDIWEEEVPARPERPWHAQMVNYVGHFPTHHVAEQFVESTKKARVLAAKSGVAEVPKKKSK